MISLRKGFTDGIKFRTLMYVRTYRSWNHNCYNPSQTEIQILKEVFRNDVFNGFELSF